MHSPQLQEYAAVRELDAAWLQADGEGERDRERERERERKRKRKREKEKEKEKERIIGNSESSIKTLYPLHFLRTASLVGQDWREINEQLCRECCALSRL